MTKREIKSARSRERWRYTLEHLITGTDHVPGFGKMFVDPFEERPAPGALWRLPGAGWRGSMPF